jgi:capsular exopolysaccharide synthesis family protein
MTLEKKIIQKLIYILLNYSRMYVLLLVFSLVGVLFQHFLFGKYQATSILYVRSQQESPILRTAARMSSMQYTYANYSESANYLKILRSKNFYDYVYDNIDKALTHYPDLEKKFAKLDNPIQSNIKERIYGEFTGSTRFSEKDSLIEIVSLSNTAEQAAFISKFMMELASDFLLNYEKKDILDTQNYLESQKLDLEANAEKINKDIEELHSGTNLLNVSIGGMESFVSKNVAKLQEEEVLVQIRITELNSFLKDLLSRLDKNTRRQLASEGSQIYRGSFYDKIGEYKNELDSQKIKLRAIQTNLEKLKSESKPQFEQRLYDSKKKLEVINTLQEEIQKQIFDNKIYQISVENRLRSYEVATPATASKDISLATKILFCILLSFMIVLITALIWDQIYPVVSSRKDAEGLGVRFVGAIPHMDSLAQRIIKTLLFMKNKNDNTSLLHKHRLRNHLTIAFQFASSKIIKTLLSITNKKSGVISLISHRQGAGKSFLASNLAVSLGSYGFKVLVIDGDWFKSEKNNYLHTELTNPGLSDVVFNDVDSHSLIQKTPFANISFLSSGLCIGDVDAQKDMKMKEVIEGMRSEFDIVLIDTPAFEAGFEGLWMSSFADMTLVVLKAHNTRIEHAYDVVEMLESRGQKNIFTMINKAESNLKKSGSYYLVQNQTGL